MKEPCKYFIAIVLPEPCLSEVEALKQELFRDYGLKGALRCPAHITLHRPFVWEQEKEKKLIEVLNQFKFSEKPEIVLHNFAFFPPRVVFIDVKTEPTLINLHDALVKHVKHNLNLFNEADDKRGFHPHVTVASRDLKKQLYSELSKIFSQRHFTAKLKVNSIQLLKLRKRWEIIHEVLF